MTSYYNNYLLSSNKNKNLLNVDPSNTDVLKKEYTLNYTDYEKLKINEQYNKLYSNIYDTNKKNIEINENKKIYNLSLYDLVQNAGVKYSILLNDLSIYFNTDNNKSFNKLGFIITKDDNLLYIGLLVLVISFLLWLINITQ
jgi:hypothetical protein